ncbi:hypothetical protein [Sandaracinus amylolyticus]|uniref:hypothetical protein n=1 Tax=Sandaracinus amylolyticus TaxID=927083 RepID=UPI001F470825|nr:hypothetical protein [Sandaracinus amylolyticus]UJR79570.1 Hypothetical protein I5071_16060 [Sandaracinus amylolyticus]
MDRARLGGGCWLFAALVIATGCGDDDGGTPSSDAGTDARVGQVDAQIEVDAYVAPDAYVEPDAYVAPPCDPGCGEGEACLRGVCVATCGGDVAAMDAALAEGLVPVANVCRAVSGPIEVVVPTGGAMPRVYEVTAATVDTTTTFTLSRWTLDPSVSAPTPETVATTTHAGHAASAIYAGGYLALSPDEARAIFGYTTSDEGFVGGVFDVAVGGGSASETRADGNFDGVWLDDAHYVVNGLGMAGAATSGQGLYVRDVETPSAWRALDEMGAYSGGVTLVGDVVIAGAAMAFGSNWPDERGGGRIFVLPREVLEDAETVSSAWDASLAQLEAPSAFTRVFGTKLAATTYMDAPPYDIASIEVRALAETGETWTLSAPVPLTTGSTFRRVVPAGTDRALLVHAGGLLIVEE